MTGGSDLDRIAWPPGGLPGPVLVIDEKKARVNITAMAAKARRANVALRPHFKTHQSLDVGAWYRDAGVSTAAVSAPEMGRYFARGGWKDIMIAVPANEYASGVYDDISSESELNLCVENAGVVSALAAKMTSEVRIWMELDTGYGRTGIAWDDREGMLACARAVAGHDRLALAGCMTHAGNTYACRGADAVRSVFGESLRRLKEARAFLAEQGFSGLRLSAGDTPGCSLADDFPGLDEIRPGNFVFYDLMQAAIGSCGLDAIAVALLCPVLAAHPERGELVVHGGAVHLSKDVLEADGQPVFGRIAAITERGWAVGEDPVYVTRVSQEHGVITAPADWIRRHPVGSTVAVLPVHSCLTVDLMRRHRMACFSLEEAAPPESPRIGGGDS